MTSLHVTWRHQSWHDVTKHGIRSQNMALGHGMWNDVKERDMRSQRMTWCHRTWHDVTTRGVTSQNMAWGHTTWHDVTEHGMTSPRVTWRHRVWHFMLPGRLADHAKRGSTSPASREHQSHGASRYNKHRVLSAVQLYYWPRVISGQWLSFVNFTIK